MRLATSRRNGVRVEGEVAGRERIIMPAGTFDPIKIPRRVYAGDRNIVELAETSVARP